MQLKCIWLEVGLCWRSKKKKKKRLNLRNDVWKYGAEQKIAVISCNSLSSIFQ